MRKVSSDTSPQFWAHQLENLNVIIVQSTEKVKIWSGAGALRIYKYGRYLQISIGQALQGQPQTFWYATDEVLVTASSITLIFMLSA